MKENIPKIRFRCFSHAWEQRKLGEVTENFEYGLNASATKYDGKNKYIRITDIDEATRSFKMNALTSPDTKLIDADNYKLQEGDVLFARTGASVGKTYRYSKKDGLVYYAGFLIKARVKPEFDVEFVFQNTLTGTYGNFISITSQRSGQPGVNAQEYANFKFFLPIKDEQTKIGAFLKQLDDTISLNNRKYDALKQLKSGYLAQIFSQNLRFSGYFGEWEVRRLGEFINFLNGKAYRQVELLNKGKYRVLRVGNFNTNDKWYYSDLELEEEKYAKKGDLLYLWATKFGPEIWKEEKVIYHYHIWKLVINEKCINKFYLYTWLETDKERIKQDTNGSTMIHVTKDSMEKREFQFPNFEEQDKIATFFNQLDLLISKQQIKVSALKKIKQAYLQKLFI
ncbi:restriction endonuclease subunit S [Lactococcus piscium]|uniref:restriction endonuclease subunit S n=1 Tax=Pseudolactococcus carnosus TaxID=2749961 RepID=UPI001FB8D4F9|nr:restriction endonuclease subunit S [Lactococcus carnosus]MCJ1995678.1 restriction endonuclease subunit S [Lactococcus carnosus]